MYVFIKTDQAIVGTEDGFSLIKMDSSQIQRPPLNLQIRKVYLTGFRDSLIYGRSYLYDTVPVVIPYSQNSIKIKYSVNNYNKSRTALYSYQLSVDGKQDVWSEYSENNVKEFTELHEGKYVFSVKLLTTGIKIQLKTAFTFEILPPWYRTWWSYLMYLIVCNVAVFIICIIIFQKVVESAGTKKNRNFTSKNRNSKRRVI